MSAQVYCYEDFEGEFYSPDCSVLGSTIPQRFIYEIDGDKGMQWPALSGLPYQGTTATTRYVIYNEMVPGDALTWEILYDFDGNTGPPGTIRPIAILPGSETTYTVSPDPISGGDMIHIAPGIHTLELRKTSPTVFEFYLNWQHVATYEIPIRGPNSRTREINHVMWAMADGPTSRVMIIALDLFHSIDSAIPVPSHTWGTLKAEFQQD